MSYKELVFELFFFYIEKREQIQFYNMMYDLRQITKDFNNL